MSKELPYFRVTVQEWQNGDISDESHMMQGLFMQICCYYWAHNCDVTLKQLEKRFRMNKKNIKNLVESKILKQNSEKIHINFLDNQILLIEKDKKFYSDMGKLGQKAKKSKAPLKHAVEAPLKHKDKDKEKDKDTTQKRKSLTREEYNNSLSEFRSKPDPKWVGKLKSEYPNVNVIASLKKICDYWATDEGYQKKIKTKTKNIDWKATCKNGLNMEWNQIPGDNDEY